MSGFLPCLDELIRGVDPRAHGGGFFQILGRAGVTVGMMLLQKLLVAGLHLCEGRVGGQIEEAVGLFHSLSFRVLLRIRGGGPLALLLPPRLFFPALTLGLRRVEKGFEFIPRVGEILILKHARVAIVRAPRALVEGRRYPRLHQLSQSVEYLIHENPSLMLQTDDTIPYYSLMVEGALAEREPYCAVIGGINIDLQGFCAAAYRAGDSNPGMVARAIGGVGRNIAENVARLGVRVELVTPLGDGEAWNELVGRTLAAGVGLNYSPRVASLSLPTYLCILEPDGRLAGAVADMAAMEELRVEHLEARRALFDGAEVIAVDGNVPRECIEWVAAKYGARSSQWALGAIPGARAGATDGGCVPRRPLLIADPVSCAKARNFSSCFGAFDIAKPNLAEAATIAGLDDGANLGDVVAALAARSNLPAELYVSMGERGMAVARPGAVEEIALCPAEKRPRAVNRSGAGDAACAALVWLSVAERRRRGLKVSALARAQFALAAALYATGSEEPVNPRLTMENLCDAAQSWYPELAPLAAAIRGGGLS